jgi:hypothetical protein
MAITVSLLASMEDLQMIATRWLELAIVGALSFCVVPLQEVVGQIPVEGYRVHFMIDPSTSCDKEISAISWERAVNKKFYEAWGGDQRDYELW